MGMSPEVISYLITRGCTIDDAYLLIPHRCQHLKVDVKNSVFKVNDDGTRTMLQEKYMCDIHDTPEYPVICKRFHGHGRYYIPLGCVYATPDGERTELELTERAKSKSLIKTISSTKVGGNARAKGG